MYGLTLYLLVVSTLTPLAGRYIGKRVIDISVLSITLALFSSLFLFYEVVYRSYTCEVLLFNWFNVYSLNSPFLLIFDKLSTSMLFLVIFISLLIHLYSASYMESDPGKIRFFFFLSLFTLFMCLMVLSGSLLQFFLAWEGVGLSSYLLINFWYTRAEANRSAMKALLVNRFGDFGLYFAILLIFATYKTMLFCSLNGLAYSLDSEITIFSFNLNMQEFISFFIFLAVVGKSAQLGLHTWLPDAMEGPTPVSALLHAATMVTAGVYLLLRVAHILETAPQVLTLIAFWGSLTAFFASTVGAFQSDIKKIIAYSTCSQLGYMVAACGLNCFSGAFYHLFNHAFFKALLFLGAGSVIHAVIDEQDLRKYGSLINLLPVTYFCMFIGSYALVGLPFLSGYYSKDIIINWSYTNSAPVSNFVYWFLVLAAFFTSYYSTKILYLTFFSKTPRFSLGTLPYIKEGTFHFKLPLAVLSLFSIFSGYLFYVLFVGYGNNMLDLPVNLINNKYFELEVISGYRKVFPLFFILAGIFSYVFFNLLYSRLFFNFFSKIKFFRSMLRVKAFFVKKWYLDYFYYFIVKKVLVLSYEVLFKSVDKGVIEEVFVKKPVQSIVNLSKLQLSYQNSNTNTYLLYTTNILLLFLILFYILGISNFIYTCFLLFFVIFKLYSLWRKL